MGLVAFCRHVPTLSSFKVNGCSQIKGLALTKCVLMLKKFSLRVKVKDVTRYETDSDSEDEYMVSKRYVDMRMQEQTCNIYSSG